MSKNDQSSNKPNSNSAGLNLPAIAKEFSNQMIGLEKFSNNSHKQFQDLVASCDSLSKSLSRLASLISNSSTAIDNLSSTKDALSSTRDEFLSIKDNLSSDVELLKSFFDDVKGKTEKLTLVNNNLFTFLNQEKHKFKIPKQDFDNLVSIVTNMDATLTTINTFMAELPNTIGEIFTSKTSSFEQKLPIVKKSYTDNLSNINTDIKFFLDLYYVAKKFFFGTIVILVLMFLLTIYNTYWIYYFSKEIQHTESIKQQDQPIETIVTPKLSPVIPKAEKKR